MSFMRAFSRPTGAAAPSPAIIASVRPRRERLAKILGVVDERLPVRELEYVGGTEQPSLVAETPTYTVRAVRWPVLPGVNGEGLLLEPRGKPVANVVAIPEADWTPEMLVGLKEGVPPRAQFARHLAANGCRVLVPVLINRRDTLSGSKLIDRWTNQPHREFIYRMAFEMGRHVIGYEVQKVLAAAAWLSLAENAPPLGVIGYGEGGLLALYSAALEPRIKAAVVSGYFGPRENVWQEPIYRNVWCLLREFGDSSFNLEIRIWINDPTNGVSNVRSEVMLKVWDKFRENGIEVPYPQRDVHFRADDRLAVEHLPAELRRPAGAA